MDGAFAVNDNLTFYGTLYFGNAEFDNGTFDLRWARIPSVCDDVVCPINGDVSGKKLDRQSKTQASLGVDWQAQLTGDWDYYVRGDVGYQSKMYAEQVNLATISDRTVANASLGFQNDRYSIQLWARNLFDEEYISSALIQAPNAAYNAYLGEKRTIGVTVNVRWSP